MAGSILPREGRSSRSSSSQLAPRPRLLSYCLTDGGGSAGASRAVHRRWLALNRGGQRLACFVNGRASVAAWPSYNLRRKGVNAREVSRNDFHD